MSFTKEDLANIASLSRISVTPEEEDKMLADMQAILGYISEINEVSGDVVRTKGEHYNIVREDIITHETGSNTEAILNEAPDTEDGYVKVAQVLK
ncbi:MAG: Asp-tRNA(Asn)/Glu-tRNA(Gln) amidotransferase subunit GatC [Candidatus Pacebacteria bacterium]|nr:Asp-tRNA(Asn)/Glu-tRNA(Gln) amidotransferase subunit GatC [Candidatus Paceibacterota bacterium]